MPKPIMIFQSPFSERWYATRAYKVMNAEKGLYEVTGHKDDITDRINEIVEHEIKKLAAHPTKAEAGEVERPSKERAEAIAHGHPDWTAIVNRLQGDREYAYDFACDMEIAKRRIAALQETVRAQWECLGFFASVIKSGEPWTETCQREYDKARGAKEAEQEQAHRAGQREKGDE